MKITKDIREARGTICKSGKSRESKRQTRYKRSARRIERQAVRCGDYDTMAKPYTGWDIT